MKLGSRDLNWTEIKLIHASAASSLRSGATHLARSPLASLEVGVTRVGQQLSKVFSKRDLAIGTVTGSANAALDYMMSSGDVAASDIITSFTVGFVGGLASSRTGNFIFDNLGKQVISRPVLAEIGGGIVGGAIGDLTDQIIRNNVRHPSDIDMERLVMTAGVAGLANGFAYRASLSTITTLPIVFRDSAQREAFSTMTTNTTMRGYGHVMKWYEQFYGPII